MSCPICLKKTEAAWRPFCSKRCADVDLARWLGEGYRIETESAPEETHFEQDVNGSLTERPH